MKDFRCNTNEINEHRKFVDSILNPSNDVIDAMNIIRKYCSENPTCERCPFTKNKVLNKNGGCYFRYHSPREWEY